MKLPTIKRKLPEVFTDENNYFGKNQSWIDTWQSCKNCVVCCTILAIPTIYLQWWWLVLILHMLLDRRFTIPANLLLESASGSRTDTRFCRSDGEQYRRRDRRESGYRIPVSGAHRCDGARVRRGHPIHSLLCRIHRVFLSTKRRLGRDCYRPRLK